MALEHGPHREGDRQVEHDGEARGERAIMDAGAVLNRDRHVADHLARRRNDDVADAIPDAAVVRDRVMLARERIAVRVPGERAAEGPVERVVALLLQGVRQFDGEAARFHHGEGAAANVHHVGVHGIVAPPPRPRRRRSAERRGSQARPDPAVAIPRRRAVPQGDAVHHAVAQEPVMAHCPGDHGVRPHLQVTPVKPRRNAPGHGEVLQCHFRRHRRVDADDERVVGFGQPPPVEGCDQLDTRLGRRAQG